MFSGNLNTNIENTENTNQTQLKDTIGDIIEIKTYSKNVRIHPMITHFSVALPIVTFFLSIMFLISHKKLLLADFILLACSSVAIYFSFATGNEAYEAIISTNISKEAKDVLLAHKRIGSVILFFTVILMTIRLVLLVYKRKQFIFIYLLIFALYSGFILYQGYIGVNMVYAHGMGVYYDYSTN